MPDGILGTAYEALGRGDSGPLLALLDARFEWVEPELAGYPLSGVHRGPDGARTVLTGLEALFSDFALDAHEVAEAGERETVTGVIRGRPGGGDEAWELSFAHVWEVADDDRYVRVRTYFDRSRLTVAAARRQLAEVADDLLEQAAEIRRQWTRLGEELGGEAEAGDDEAGDGASGAGSGASAGASARLAAVDMAEEGAGREEVEAMLRDDLGVEDPAPILDEVFGVPGSEPEPAALRQQRAAIVDATRLSRLFARNRG
jgi:ketosteroid isomerase-like protein